MFLEELTINLYNIALHKTVYASFLLNIEKERLHFLPLHSPKKEGRTPFQVQESRTFATSQQTREVTIKYAVSHAM